MSKIIITAVSLLLMASFGVAAEVGGELTQVTKPIHTTEQQARSLIHSININSAGLKQLVKLKGVGKAKAQAIIDYRTQHGQFASIDGLMKVTGIGQKIIEQNKGRIIF